MKSSFATCALGLTVLAAALPAAAQISKPMDEAAIQRSYDMQAQVARIEQDKESFIRDFVASWAPQMSRNPLFANSAKQLYPLLRAASPFRLYAASLVGDYNGMVQVLKGEVSSAKVINTLSAPQPKAVPGSALTVGAALPTPLLGSGTSQLVFTPIAPCRIADTRGAGARTGLFAAGVPRTFDLTSTGFSKGQGGSSSCPGLPSFNNYAWSVNATLTGYGTTGYLQVYPYGGSIPATSLMNFGTALPAIANSSSVTGCYGCGDSINVVASAPTHLILDVYGYYEVATGYATGAISITPVAGTSASVAAGVYTSVYGGVCPAGTTVIGGGQTNGSGSANTILTSDHYFSGNGWYEYVKNTGTSATSVTVYSICQEIF